ncbi:hypothetical protein [Microbispora sp. GKU 823]|nr:hypothetical protein [Microbispora sp. GKU 823]
MIFVALAVLALAVLARGGRDQGAQQGVSGDEAQASSLAEPRG